MAVNVCWREAGCYGQTNEKRDLKGAKNRETWPRNSFPYCKVYLEHKLSLDDLGENRSQLILVRRDFQRSVLILLFVDQPVNANTYRPDQTIKRKIEK